VRVEPKKALLHLNGGASCALVSRCCCCRLLCAQAVFKSDNISTVAIIKEAVTTFATARNVRVSTKFEVSDASVAAMLRRIDPKLVYQSTLARKVELVKGLSELDVQEDDTSYLDEEYADILRNRERYQKEHKQSPTALHNLCVRACVRVQVAVFLT
jgi:hypothetical protein